MSTEENLTRLDEKLQSATSQMNRLKTMAQETLESDDQNIMSLLRTGVWNILRLYDALFATTFTQERYIKYCANGMTACFAQLAAAIQEGLNDISEINRQCQDIDVKARALQGELQELTYGIQKNLQWMNTRKQRKESEKKKAESNRDQKAKELETAEQALEGAKDDRNDLRVVRGVTYSVGIFIHPLLLAIPFLELGASELRDGLASAKSHYAKANTNLISSTADVDAVEKELATIQTELLLAKKLSTKQKELATRSTSVKTIT